MKTQNRHYLAHEYFNQDWYPMPFSEMAELLGPAKLSFACSAAMANQLDAINLSAEQRDLVHGIQDPVFQQTVRDFMTNAQFRKDYWVKGPRKLSSLEKIMAARALRVVMFVPRNGAKLTFNTGLGEIKLNEVIYGSLYDLLSDHKARTLGEIEAALKERGIELHQILEATMLAVEMGLIGLAQDEATVAKVRPATDRLNADLMNKARTSDDVTFLASPVTGGGIPVSRFDQLYMLARAQGCDSPAKIAQFVWNLLRLQGRKLMKEGKQLDTEEANVAELQKNAMDFIELRLPLMRALGVTS